MPENFRRFLAGPDPFGRVWDVEFKWLQTAISIRHSDTVDVKFMVSTEGEPKQEKVLALPHKALLDLSRETGHALTDPWCLRMAALHLQSMVTQFEDWDKTLVTLSPGDLKKAAAEVAVV